jgi:preprotein translocase SecE subunit
LTTDAYKPCRLFYLTQYDRTKKSKESWRSVARKVKQNTPENEQTLSQVFWQGFWWPIKGIYKGAAWLTHHFPLKHLGHALRWFFMLPPLRFLGSLLGFRFVRDSWRELKQVTWPTFRESMRLTSAVIIFSIVFGFIIAVVDFGLDKVFKSLFVK